MEVTKVSDKLSAGLAAESLKRIHINKTTV